MTKVFNQPKQKLLRQNLRKMPIGCERKLWNRLRNKQLGYKFFRQYGIGRYIVDFYCPKLKLAVEIDGATHSADEEIKKDVIRQKFIESLGVTFKRYNNSDIKDNFSEVVYDIQKTCELLTSNSPRPSLC
jgi:very-short-patch-repair endonuclease